MFVGMRVRARDDTENVYQGDNTTKKETKKKLWFICLFLVCLHETLTPMSLSVLLFAKKNILPIKRSPKRYSLGGGGQEQHLHDSSLWVS